MANNPTYRVIFPSYDWDDAWLVNQIINRPKVVGAQEIGFRKGVPQEEGLTDDDDIRAWIDKNMDGCSCLILFVGEKTYLSKWVKYELEHARERGMGRFMIYLDGMTKKDGSICGKGQDPYRYHGMYAPSGSPGGYTIQSYSWITDHGDQRIGEWIEEACLRAGK